MKYCFLILMFLSSWIFIGCDETTGRVKVLEGPIQHMELEQAIGLMQNKKYRNLLREFTTRFSKKDSFYVTSHEDHFEIIVSHPSTGDYTGGAEQYFLDKHTGMVKMGWHEHPMAIRRTKGTDGNAQ